MLSKLPQIHIITVSTIWNTIKQWTFKILKIKKALNVLKNDLYFGYFSADVIVRVDTTVCNLNVSVYGVKLGRIKDEIVDCFNAEK